ncbi:ABC-type organic anion transporter ABCA8B-like isoform X1 [Physella acuta]|uniref:ABC-type organic anion transporter ABCA8B-like isoform X1 n=2 Tax=Physella acuta TaxID=109671 RepID=UPI0027DCC977|nr:ABC-type organic anion transporter ABCA8B-like isoform X1 [Physella acuta]
MQLLEDFRDETDNWNLTATPAVTMASFWQQLKALLWRNILLKKRKKSMLFQEFFYPVYFVAILAIVKIATKPDVKPAMTFPVNNLSDLWFNYVFHLKHDIYVVPKTAEVKNWMDDIVNQLSGSLRYQMFATVEEAETAFRHNSSSVLAGIIFNYKNNKYSYALRVGYHDIPGTNNIYHYKGDSCRNSKTGTDVSSDCPVNNYLATGFVTLQVAIENVLMKNAGLTSFDFKSRVIQLQLMDKVKFNPDTSYIQTLSSIYFVFSFSILANFLAVNIVAEKEKKIKEGMLMMGLRTSVFWLSWALIYLVMVLLASALMIALIVGCEFFQRSNMFLLYLVFFLYGCSIIALAFMLTPFFKKAKVAGVVTGFSTVIISCLHLVVSQTRDPSSYDSKLSPGVEWLMCLLSPLAFSSIIDKGIFLDIQYNGFGFDDSLTFGKFPLYAPILMLIVDTILYSLLTVYFDNVIPGEYGVRYSPFYFLEASYWCSSTIKEESLRLISASESRLEKSDVEPVSKEMEMKVGLRISSLTKSFVQNKKTVKAVNDFSLDIFESQITCLLGHNGAGKTTLINMLTGVVPPTSGTATIMGLNITDNKQLEYIRNLCGICPQHNILYDDLSCAEHLKMFANIKGVPEHLINKRIESALKEVDLSDQAHTFAKNLSGGQKRKLSVAIALIGDPKLMFLDEPTAGMDPFSRRHLWSLLKKKKEGRVILLTTHFMDEADILSDRKAFIRNGKLRCCGSSMFLKKKFGIGYHLTMVTTPECQVDEVTSMLTSVIPSTKHQRTHGKEIAYTMSLNDVPTFSTMFDVIDRNAVNLGIEGYGVSMTTLEEVFLNLESDEFIEQDEDDMAQVNLSYNLAEDATEVNIQSPDNIDFQNFKPTVQGATLSLQRFKALMKIRFLLVIRSVYSLIFQIILPVLFVVIGLVLAKVNNVTPAEYPTPLQLNTSHYASSLGDTTHLPGLLAYDAVDSANSKYLIDDWKSYLAVDSYPAKTKNTSAVAPHFLGLQINSLTQKALTNFVIIYNDTALHSIPVAINFVTHSLLRMFNISTYIEGNSFPWPEVSAAIQFNSGAMASVLMVGLAFISVLPGFAGDIVKDRELKLRGQLRIAGVTFNQYWGTIYLVDILIYLIPSVSVLIIVLAMQVPGLNSEGAIAALVLIFITNIPLNILLALVVSFIFDKSESCHAYLSQILTMVCLLPYLTVSLVDMLAHSEAATVIHYICCIFDPPYTIFGGIYYISRIYLIATLSQQEVSTSDYFKFENHVVITIIMPLINFIWMYWLLRVLDVKKMGGDFKEAFPCYSSTVSYTPLRNRDSSGDEDEDIRAERLRIESLNANAPKNTASSFGLTQNNVKQPVAYTYELRKDYVKRTNKTSLCNTASMKTKTAVRNLSIGVDEGEVLGLLGPNGAGKTTALSMIIAETKPTCGQVVVNGNNMRSNVLSVLECLAYCPQLDALWETITLEEHLKCFADIKGLSQTNVRNVVNYYIENLKLAEHQKKQTKALSGGTKRKLSYILSILGSPQLVLLDEPSTGMDPQSKRFLWDTISSSFKNTNRGAILTTHYMEEADALCGRVGIMVNGQLECLGSTQHLKNKYGSGYILEVKLENNNVSDIESKMDDLENHLKMLFPGLENVERFQERAQYSIPKDDVKNLGETFSHLESCRSTHGLEEYNFSQSTLEQVFLYFAKLQMEEDEVNTCDRPRRLSHRNEPVSL